MHGRNTDREKAEVPGEGEIKFITYKLTEGERGREIESAMKRETKRERDRVERRKE